MATYSYAQLETLWINAGGSRALAPIMAAIAEAESGGNSDAYNPSGASGLWQILGNPFPGNPFDPGTNARMAVAKWKSQGLGAWTTYTSGAYKAYVQGKTTPDPNVPGSGTATATLTAAQVTQRAATARSDCMWSIGFVNSSNSGPSAWGWIGAAIHDFMNPASPAAPTSGGEICIIRKSEMRGVAGIGLMLAGAVVALPGIVLLAAAVGGKVESATQPLISTASKFTPAGKAASIGTQAAAKMPGRTPRPTPAAPAKPDEAAIRARLRTRADQVSTRVEPRQGTLADERGTSPEFRRRYGTA